MLEVGATCAGTCAGKGRFPGEIRLKKQCIKSYETCFANTHNLNKAPRMKCICSPKIYGPLTIWPWLRISPESSLNVIYCLIFSAGQWLMSLTYTPWTPMQIKPLKSQMRNRLLALLLWQIHHLSCLSRSCLGRLILILGGIGSWRRGHYGKSPLPPLALRIKIWVEM